MSEYPFHERVKELLKKKEKTIGWLIGALDKSPSWFHAIKSIKDLQLKVILDLSEILDFDLIEDLYKWKGESLNVAEPIATYLKPKKEISVTVTITGEEESLFENLGKTLKAVKKESERNGLKIG